MPSIQSLSLFIYFSLKNPTKIMLLLLISCVRCIFSRFINILWKMTKQIIFKLKFYFTCCSYQFYFHAIYLMYALFTSLSKIVAFKQLNSQQFENKKRKKNNLCICVHICDGLCILLTIEQIHLEDTHLVEPQSIY